MSEVTKDYEEATVEVAIALIKRLMRDYQRYQAEAMAIQDDQKKMELLEGFKKENEKMIDMIKDIMKNVDKAEIQEKLYNDVIKEVQEFAKNFDANYKQTMEEIKEIKARIKANTKEGQEILGKLDSIEKNQEQRFQAKEQLMSKINEKYHERTPTQKAILEFTKQDDMVKGFNFDRLGEKGDLLFRRDENNNVATLDQLIIRKNDFTREVSIVGVKDSVQMELKKVPFKEINNLRERQLQNEKLKQRPEVNQERQRDREREKEPELTL